MRLIYRLLPMAVLVLASYTAGSLHVRRSDAEGTVASASTILYYRCPMHPAITSGRPGTAPCCGMQFEPVFAGAGEVPAPQAAGPVSTGRVQIASEQQQVIGIRTEEVVGGPGAGNIVVPGRIALDENRVFRIAPPLDGLIRKISPVATGDMVQKGTVIATYLNREVLRPEQAYVQALAAAGRLNDRRSDEQSESAQSLIQAAEENLEYLGVSQEQMLEIARTRKTTAEVEVRSPASGILMSRNVYPGTRFERGTELFRIADMDRVWVIADLFENDAALVQGAKSAVVSCRGRKISARIVQSPPQFDPASRTMKIRLELDNADLSMRPDMFVEVEFKINLPSGLTVPADALIDSGRRKLVYVDCGNGCFEPRPVEIGRRLNDRVQIVRGLAAGERVVVSGNFLIDSESRLQTAIPDARR